VGIVLSDSADKTITVGVSWHRRHAIYAKPVHRLTRFMTHDEQNEAKEGDRVLIEETRPLSRNKRWRLVEIVERGDLADVQPSDVDPESGLETSE
jgi:small subunit ribosomal protein S17